MKSSRNRPRKLVHSRLRLPFMGKKGGFRAWKQEGKRLTPRHGVLLRETPTRA